MISNILIGLQALASITGVSSWTKYEMDAQDYINIASSINSVVNFENNDVQIDGISRFDDVYAISGENRYLEAELDNGGFILYDKKENEIIQYSLTNSPYQSNDDTLKVYFNDGNDSHYLTYDCINNSFLDFNASLFDFSNYDFYGSRSHPETFFHPEITPGTNATLISNSFYFQKLNDYHGANYEGDELCCVVAAQILLGYYDTFVNDTIVDEMYDKITEEYVVSSNVEDFSQSPGTGKESGDDADQRFRDYLIDITTDILGESPIGRTMLTSEQRSLIRRYLNASSFSYVINSSEGNMSDLLTNRARDIIENAIDHGRPVICNGRGHSVVAYGYDSNYVYVHTGWGYAAATPWSTYTYSTTNYYHNIGAIDIRFTCDHVHSDNYYSSHYHKHYCPDGFTYEHAIFNPEDYNYQAQYFFYDKLKYIYYDDYAIDTKRLRTGYIENQFINLSPRRQDAGVAYLEYYAPTYIKSIKVSISFWSEHEQYIASNHQAKIQYYQNGLWRDSFDLLNDINLSTDRTNQDILYITFPAGVDTFRFYAENYPIGNQNKGRISIGNLKIIHE